VNNVHRAVEAIGNETVLMCLFVQLRKQMRLFRILKSNNRMKGDICESADAIGGYFQCSLWAIGVSGYHNFRIGTAMQKPKHVARSHRIQEHIFWIIQSAISTKGGCRRTGEWSFAIGRQGMVARVSRVTRCAGTYVSSPFDFGTELMLVAHWKDIVEELLGGFGVGNSLRLKEVGDFYHKC